jgi:hypothetical protein
MCTRRGGDLHDEQDIDTCEADRVHVQEVTRQNAFGLAREELRPGRPGPAVRGIDPSRVEDLPYGTGRYPVDQPD